MAVDEIFLRACLTLPPMIMGRQLRPFSAGHALVLEALENPFVRGGPRTLAALAEAVLVCSKALAENRLLFGFMPGAAPETIEERRQSLECEGAKWAQELDGKTFLPELTRFEEYLKAYQAIPEHWVTVGRRHFRRAPYFFEIAVGVVMGTNGGVPLEEAWELPLNLAAAIASTVGAINGADSLIQPDEQAARAALKNAPPPRRREKKGKTP